MKNCLFILILLLFSSAYTFAQENSFDEVDQLMLSIPKSMEKSSDLIAQFINKKFNDEPDKIRAIYFWIVKNITYDIKNLKSTKHYKGKQQLINRTLHQRKAVCQGYATLFNDLATKAGINSYIISGYTKQYGEVNQLGHAWCVAKIDSKWFVFDPTWGAGYILNYTKYVKSINNDYFKADPIKIIESHMPIDPLWQLLNYPISNQAFYEGNTAMDNSKIFFNYRDSLSMHEKQTELDQFESSIRRIQAREIKNKIIKDHINYIEIEIDYFQNQKNIETFNLAIDNFNEGVKFYNDFINYRNNDFKPRKSNVKIRAMLDSAIKILRCSKDELSIENPKRQLEKSIRKAQREIDQLLLKCQKQQSFLETNFKNK